MGGRGSSSASAATSSPSSASTLSSRDSALRDYLMGAADQNSKSGASAQNRERAAEYRAAAGLIGTDRIVTLTNSESYKELRNINFAGYNLSGANVDSYLKGKKKPRGMSDERFSDLQRSLRDLKSQGFSNDEIIGAVHNFGSNVWK